AATSRATFKRWATIRRRDCSNGFIAMKSAVASGLKWFRRWKNPNESDWAAFCRQLKFPLSPQRAKGVTLNVEGRRDAGLDPAFIAELNVYSQSRGRT